MSENWIKVIGISCSVLLSVANSGFDGQQEWKTLCLEALILLISSFSKWEGVFLIIRISRRKYPRLTEVKQRIGFSFTYSILTLIGIYLLINLSYSHFVLQIPFRFGWHRMVAIIISSLYFVMCSIGLFEAVYYYSSYNRSLLEKEELRRANLQSQIDSLKAQVSPHFLFNSLNSLSTLIMTNPQSAEHFVEELSTVYRHLLRSGEKTLITLQEELQLIRSYHYLLATRFGSNLSTDIEVAPHHLDYLLPPLTLQLLIENAVKHNIISNEQPLHVSIYTTNKGHLFVVNNLQKKLRGVLSEKKGLNNIIAKYYLLHQPLPEVIETDKEFIVNVPLIAPSKLDVH